MADVAFTASLHEQMPLCATLGMRAGQLTPEKVVLSIDWAAELCTGGGVLHGGVITTAADSAAGRCAFLNGAPAVFLSALGLSSKMWQHQTIALADHGIRCVAYDRRGHGRSDDPGHGYDYDTLAGDLAALLDLLDLSEVTLIGASMACGEIVRYLSRFGDERVARIAFVAPAGPFPLRAPDNPNGVEPAAAEALLAGVSEN